LPEEPLAKVCKVVKMEYLAEESQAEKPPGEKPPRGRQPPRRTRLRIWWNGRSIASEARRILSPTAKERKEEKGQEKPRVFRFVRLKADK